MAGELHLTATMHRKAYQVMPNAQQAYLLLEAMPSKDAVLSSTQPVNFCLALDHSGSMAGEKLRHLKEAARLVTDKLGPSDLLSVVVFDDENPADLIVPSGAVLDREVIKSRIDTIQEGGGTHMSTGMRLGLSELEKGRNSSQISSMLLLTDGQTWEDQQECLDLADRFRAAGIPIYVLGMGVGADSNWDPQLLEEIARRSGGEWIVVDNPEKVSSVFEKTLVAIQGVALTNAQLTMRLVEGVTPRMLWRVIPLIGRLDTQAVSDQNIQLFLGDISSGTGQALLADMSIPAYAMGTHRLIQADISYDVPSTALIGQKVSLDILVAFTEDAMQANQLEGRVMNIVERVVAHKLQTQALDEAAAGEAAMATQRLRAAATRLLELGEVELAEQANEQASKIEQDGQLDIAAAQRMRYSTKRLTEIDMPE